MNIMTANSHLDLVLNRYCYIDKEISLCLLIIAEFITASVPVDQGIVHHK